MSERTGSEPNPDQARRLAEIFGEVLPESTGDDVDHVDDIDAEPPDSDATERWYVENRPPHHDQG